jgi:isocitrate/isopropylmalate dehydrogenase
MSWNQYPVRDVVTEVHDYPEVELSHMYADNGAMQLVLRPNSLM